MTLDKGQDPQDSHLEDKAPGEGEGTSPGGEPETFTKAQLDEAVGKAIQKARIDTGREAKAKHDEALNKALKDKDDEISELTRRIDEIDDEKYRDDPDGKRAREKEKALRDKEKAIAAREKMVEAEKEANADKLKRLNELETENVIIRAAVANHLDINTLTAKCKKLGLATEEQIQEMAETLASTRPPQTPTLDADSNRSSGGDGQVTPEWAEKASMDEYIARRKKQDPNIL